MARRWQARPQTWWWIAAVVVLPVLTLTAVSLVLLLATTHPATAGDQINLVRTALSVGAGAGGVVALVLSGRRQWHSEEAQRDTREDALARRITELYGKAVEQLGSDKAPVRLGGLYALERLAQDNPSQRPTIVAVICAYLRMPFEIPDQPPTTDAGPDLRAEHRAQVQELQVRLTAQRILTQHLQIGADPDRPSDTYWSDMDLDLTGATLLEFSLEGCRLATARFDKTRFVGPALFREARFAGPAWFSEATFHGSARFSEARFEGPTRFVGTQFSDEAGFRAVQFADTARFSKARFLQTAGFDGSRFAGHTAFDDAEFAETAGFSKSRFVGGAVFDRARFVGHAWFDDVEFTDTVGFGKAHFVGTAWFDGTRFAGDAWFTGARFSDDLGFNRRRGREGQVEPLTPCWVLLEDNRTRSFPHGWSVLPTPDQPETAVVGRWGRLTPNPAPISAAP
jgi:uncharacterized protein YjbI with pentapeptide repeats/membrane protein implicated in regulation of membrane protease activity